MPDWKSLLFCYIILFSGIAKANKTVIGYFPNWLYDKYPVSKIDFTKYTHIHYAFANMVKGNTPEWTDDQNTATQLPLLVSAAHQKKVKVLISVGGWSGSISFSSMAKDTSSRKEFINWNIDQIKKYKTDGVDIDWEYPGQQGAGCNTFNATHDIPNFLTLLQELRRAFDSHFKRGTKELSIAGYVGGMDGNLTLFSTVLDRVNVMTYDINGPWNPQTGPNSPFKAPFNGTSYSSGIQTWIKKGIPANKLTGGLAFYGRSTIALENMTKTKSQYQAQVQGKTPKGDMDDVFWKDPYCSKEPGGMSGEWSFGHLLSQGVLGSPTKATEGWVRSWDNTSQTPWLFNPRNNTFISYDDPLSIKVKVDYVLCQELNGVMVWSVDQDSENADLLNAAYRVRNGSKPKSCSILE